MCDALAAHRDELLDLAVANGGNTRSDAKFDVDGAIFTLAAYAELGKALGDARACWRTARASPSAAARASTASTSRCRATGVAVHVNAFNFPAWGLAEKAAVALLAGMPVVSQARDQLGAGRRTASWRSWSRRRSLPEGALSLLVGGAGDLLDAPRAAGRGRVHRLGRDRARRSARCPP